MSTITTEVSTERLVHELLIAERAIDKAEARAEVIKAELVERLGVNGKFETDEAKVAIVAAQTKVVDVDALQAVASRGLFYKLTKRVVDMTTFKAFDALGSLPAEVQEIVVIKTAKATPRITVKV